MNARTAIEARSVSSRGGIARITRLARVAIAAFSALATLNGCSIGLPDIPQSTEIDGSGQSNLPQTQTVSCGTLAELDRYIAGSGDAQIQVTDGAGKTVYDQPADVTGEINDQMDLTGIAGTWTLTVDGDISGQFKITLQCL
jgi:hypothetical protein